MKYFDIDNIQIFDKIYIFQCIANNLAGYAPIEVDIENPEDIIIHLGNVLREGRRYRRPGLQA